MMLHSQFGIDEIYFHEDLDYALLEKLHSRAMLSLDCSDNVVQKYTSHDMILVFSRQAPNNSIIYRFLESLDKYPGKKDFIKDNTILNQKELFDSVKTKNFVLVTHRNLIAI